MGNGEWGMGAGFRATFEMIDVRRADVRHETVICGAGLGATFEMEDMRRADVRRQTGVCGAGLGATFVL